MLRSKNLQIDIFYSSDSTDEYGGGTNNSVYKMVMEVEVHA
jgi:hypothetical protein